MDWPHLLIIAAALGLDAMSVCMAVGVRWHGWRQKARLAATMGGFQFIMPLLGWQLGSRLAGAVSSWGTYLAAGCVGLIGIKMLIEAWKSHPGATAEAIEHEVERDLHLKATDPTRGWSLILLAVATSIDALVVGFSLGLKDALIWRASITIGVVAAVMALVGVVLGRRIGVLLGRPAEFLGGVVLIGLGVSFLCF
jgi:manganese efflux pump family protein